MDPSPSGARDGALRANETEPVPLGQRLFDNMYLLLALGLIVMLVIFTAWGMWEIMSMPADTLP